MYIQSSANERLHVYHYVSNRRSYFIAMPELRYISYLLYQKRNDFQNFYRLIPFRLVFCQSFEIYFNYSKQKNEHHPFLFYTCSISFDQHCNTCTYKCTYNYMLCKRPILRTFFDTMSTIPSSYISDSRQKLEPTRHFTY